MWFFCCCCFKKSVRVCVTEIYSCASEIIYLEVYIYFNIWCTGGGNKLHFTAFPPLMLGLWWFTWPWRSARGLRSHKAPVHTVHLRALLSSHRPSAWTHLQRRCPRVVVLAVIHLKNSPWKQDSQIPILVSDIEHRSQKTAEVQFIVLSGLYPNYSILSGFLKKLHGFDYTIWSSVCGSFCTSHFFHPIANFQEINFQRWPYSHSYSKNWQGRKSRLNTAAMNSVSNRLGDQHTWKSDI